MKQPLFFPLLGDMVGKLHSSGLVRKQETTTQKTNQPKKKKKTNPN
jgi:hypothetical protein